MDLTFDKNRYTIANVYAPNYDTPDFFRNLFNKVDSLENNKKIIGGDFYFKSIDRQAGQQSKYFHQF